MTITSHLVLVSGQAVPNITPALDLFLVRSLLY
jgi:hypothetical protein